MHKFLLTPEGLSDIKKEHEELVNVKRPENVKRVALAREQGDLSENSEYAAAREELSMLDGRIEELEEIIKNVQIIPHKHSKSAIDLGCKVTLHINSHEDVFHIVGEWEANPKEKKISQSSPLGKALMGKKPGDEIDVEAPAGKIRYKIIKIE